MNIEIISKLLGGGLLASPDVYEAISTPLIKSSELGISQRNLSYWRKEGLFIHDSNFEKHEHIRFSFIEYVWLNIIVELRKYDISFDVIKLIMNSLTVKIPFSMFIENPEALELSIKNLSENDRIEALNILHDPETINILNDPDAVKEIDELIDMNGLTIFILYSIINQCHLSFLVNLEGNVYPFSLNFLEDIQKDENFQEFYQKTHIAISVTEIIKGYIKGANLELCSGKLRLISDREAEIIKILRNNKLSSMTIHFDDNSQLNLIEVEEKYDRVKKEARLVDLIMSHGYQTIEIKTQDGKIVHCKNLKKIKYTKA